MTPALVPVTRACLAAADGPARAASAEAHFHSAARRRADDKFDSCDAGPITRRRVHADRTSPRRYPITDRSAGSWACSGRSGLAFTAAVGGVLSGGGDPGGGRRLGLMAGEES